jgi:molybdenum cofactor synthesis domain-containing protein
MSWSGGWKALATGLADRAIVTDDKALIAEKVQAWVAREDVDIIITTGGTGFTGRDVTPDAIEPLFDKRMEGFSTLFHQISFEKIGTSTLQSRATAGLIGTTFVFCLPGSPGACKDGWDGILATPARLPAHALQFRGDHAAARRAPKARRAITALVRSAASAFASGSMGWARCVRERSRNSLAGGLTDP